MRNDTPVNPTATDDPCQCGACRHYHPLENGHGRCHRFPPQYTGNESPVESHRWRFPVVYAGNGCGEYRPRRADRGPEPPPSLRGRQPE
jgi:hypothetical protein